jgi:hypothetical protein
VQEQSDAGGDHEPQRHGDGDVERGVEQRVAEIGIARKPPQVVETGEARRLDTAVFGEREERGRK